MPGQRLGSQVQQVENFLWANSLRSRSRTPKIPGGNSREFLKFWRELRGIYSSFVFFPMFIVDYDILGCNLTHCMCTTHDRLFTAFWAKPWVTSLTQLFVYRVPVYFQILISKNHWTASDFRKLRSLHEDAEIRSSDRLYRPRFCIHRPGMEGVLRGGNVRGRLSGRGGRC